MHTQPVKYEIFLSANGKAVYKYRSDKAFYGKLNQLVVRGTLDGVWAYVRTIGKWYWVAFSDGTWGSKHVVGQGAK